MQVHSAQELLLVDVRPCVSGDARSRGNSIDSLDLTFLLRRTMVLLFIGGRGRSMLLLRNRRLLVLN